MIKNFKKRLVVLGFGVVLASILAGCSGFTGGTTGSTVASGGFPAYTATATDAVDASDRPVTITFPDGTSGTLVDDALAAGEEFSVLPADYPILSDMFVDDGRAQGDVFIYKGAVKRLVGSLRNHGTAASGKQGAQLVRRLCLKKGRSYKIEFEGPFVLRNGRKRLHIGVISARFEVDLAGKVSLPTKITAVLPGDGGNAADAGNFVLTHVQPAFEGRSFTLKIEHANGTLIQTQVAAGGDTTYLKHGDTANGHFPGSGVDVVDLSIN